MTTVSLPTHRPLSGWVQLPRSQTSSVQGLTSALQGALFAALSHTCSRVQLSVVHGLKSLQSMSTSHSQVPVGGCVQAPPEQTSSVHSSSSVAQGRVLSV